MVSRWSRATCVAFGCMCVALASSMIQTSPSCLSAQIASPAGRLQEGTNGKSCRDNEWCSVPKYVFLWMVGLDSTRPCLAVQS